MYNAELDPQQLSLDRLYLDPNNPRFHDRRVTVPSRRIVEPEIQAKALERLTSCGIRELANSILRNGFLPLDRIVVTPIAEAPDSYVVVEGNRRLAALRVVRDQIRNDDVDADDLPQEYLASLNESIDKIDCLVYTGTNTSIAWILQGIRHLSGIWDWSPAQKAELIVKEIDEGGLKFSAVGQMLGMTANQVGKYYRAFKALEQMRLDDDFGDRFDKALFTLFDEAYSKQNVRRWLEWSNEQNQFLNSENLHLFYSWITPDPDHDGLRRIHDPRQMRALNRLVEPDHLGLLQQVDDWEINIEEAEARMAGDTPVLDWRSKIAQVEDALNHLPLSALEDGSELTERLRQLEHKLHQLVQRVQAVSQP